MNVRYRVELNQCEREQLSALLSGGKRAARKLKRDLEDSLAVGSTLEDAARYLLRPICEVAKTAAELGMLAKHGGKLAEKSCLSSKG